MKRIRLIKFRIVKDRRGNLAFIEGMKDARFQIRRIYYIYDVPGGSKRGGHGHKKLEQIIIAINGSFDLYVTDGKQEKRFHLFKPDHGVFLPKNTWREITNFSSGAVCLVIASQRYNIKDYLHTYTEFKKWTARK